MNRITINSPLELAVMGLLAQQSHSGYDLLKIFSETAMGSFGNSPGAIYPVLRRLDKSKAVSGKVANRDSLRPKQVFSLTTCGRKALEEHLLKPITLDDVVRREEYLMLRFVFTGELLGGKRAQHFLSELIERINEYIPLLKKQLVELQSTENVFAQAALEHGIELYATKLRWARKTVKNLPK